MSCADKFLSPTGSVELQKRSLDLEEGSHLLAAKQRKPSARSYLDFQAGPDAISDSSSSEGEADFWYSGSQPCTYVGAVPAPVWHSAKHMLCMASRKHLQLYTH